MNKLFLWIALTTVVVLQSCEKTDGIRDEIEHLKDRITALETQIGEVNRNIAALHKLMDEATVIVGVTPTPTGYEIALSDGSKYPLTFGDKISALVPLMAIDGGGFWTYSLNDGKDYVRLLVDGKPVSAWPVQGGKPTPGAEGVTPKLKVDADGYWLISTDGGVKYELLLLNGEKVNAVGDNVTVSYSSVFKTVVYNAEKGTLSIELLDGTTLALAVQDSFGLTLVAADPETFSLGESRAFEVVQKNLVEAVLIAPTGWTAKLDETTLTVTAPTAFRPEAANVKLSIKVQSPENYAKIIELKMTLVNKTIDANTCVAWQKFDSGALDNVLLDFSYAGYKRGEVAPPDVWGLGYTVYDVTKYGADATGKTSSRGALIALLKELKLTGASTSGSNLSNASAQAIIYFPQGRYILHNTEDDVDGKSEEIFIRGGDFVIKGAGRDKTTLVMDSPNLPANSTNLWSSPMMINIKHNSGTSDLTTVTADAPRGAFSVEVGGTTGIKSGDWVQLRLYNSDPELVAQQLAPHVVEGPMTDIKEIKIEDYHQVRSVSGSTVTFYEPLLYAVEAKWGWKVQKFPHYENVGVEDLTFEGHAKEEFGHHVTWEDDGAYKPLNMMRLTNSWVRRVDFLSVSEALTIVGSANCSAYDIEIRGNRGHSAVRSQSSSRIFIGKVNDHSSGKECISSSGAPGGTFLDNAGQYHASGVSNTSLGAVLWNNTWGEDAFFESHSKQPRATLVDRSMGGFVQWRFGGDETNVPNHLQDLTIWNLNATVAKHDFGGEAFKWWLSSDKWWKTLPPTIVGLHGVAINFDTDPMQIKYLESNGTAVQPQSLYEAQLRRRLGYVPAWLNSLK